MQWPRTNFDLGTVSHLQVQVLILDGQASQLLDLLGLRSVRAEWRRSPDLDALCNSFLIISTEAAMEIWDNSEWSRRSVPFPAQLPSLRFRVSSSIITAKIQRDAVTTLVPSRIERWRNLRLCSVWLMQKMIDRWKSITMVQNAMFVRFAVKAARVI